jgi:regulator of sigma E protease
MLFKWNITGRENTMQLLGFIFGIAALIFVHELGHFIAARLLKVEVEEFGIGFPPRITKLFEHKGTIYTLNWIPLGGFVRPKGENDPNIEGGLAAASPWVRLGVLFAGPVMNLLVGVILGIMLFYSLGDRVVEKVLVQSTASGSPAAEAGMQPGDLFISANGQAIDSVEKLQSIVSENVGKTVTFVLQRGNQNLTVNVVPRTEPPEGQGPLGVGLDNPTRPVSLLTASYRGVYAAYENVHAILLLPVRMIRGQVTPQEGRLVGYKGMYDIYQRIQSPLWFFMMISISLGIMNLLPLPALDGGRIVMTLPEILFRRRVPMKYENAIHLVGFAMLLLLLIYINVQDFINPIKLP